LIYWYFDFFLGNLDSKFLKKLDKKDSNCYGYSIEKNI